MRKSPSRNKIRPPDPPPYDFNQTMRWLNHVKFDHWWQTQMPFSHLTLACVMQVSSRYIKLILSGRPTHLPYRMMDRIARVIPEIENRSIAFPHLPKYDFKNPTAGPPAKFFRLDVPDHPARISKLAPREIWSLWARCSACDNNKFMPIILNEKPHIACYHCVPPAHYRQIGAQEEKKSLIHEALKKFY